MASDALSSAAFREARPWLAEFTQRGCVRRSIVQGTSRLRDDPREVGSTFHLPYVEEGRDSATVPLVFTPEKRRRRSRTGAAFSGLE